MPITTQSTAAARATRNVHGECEKDTTPPPTPSIQMAVAFDRASKRATLVPLPPAPPSITRRAFDPVYIELADVEPGTHFELLNLSKHPNGTFAKHGISLEPTGRDVPNRAAAIYLNDAQLKKLDIKPGDAFAIRAVDEAGNASVESARGFLDHNSWAGGRMIQDTVDRKSFTAPGNQLSCLDGEAVRKNLMARTVEDGRLPVVLEDRVTLKAGVSGAATFLANQAMEPGASITIVNLRTSGEFYGNVDANTGAMSVELSDMKAGDPLVLRPVDRNGIAGKEIRLTYAPKCKGGKSKPRAAFETRLPGVI
jgi:hypothetical protein